MNNVIRWLEFLTIVIPTVVLLIGAVFIAALLRVLFEPVVFGTAVVSTCFLIAGWKLLFRALEGTARDALKVHWIWWAFALLGSIVALTALLKVVLGIHVSSVSVDLCLRALAFGSVAVIPFAHIVFELVFYDKQPAT